MYSVNSQNCRQSEWVSSPCFMEGQTHAILHSLWHEDQKNKCRRGRADSRKFAHLVAQSKCRLQTAGTLQAQCTRHVPQMHEAITQANGSKQTNVLQFFGFHGTYMITYLYKLYDFSNLNCYEVTFYSLRTAGGPLDVVHPRLRPEKNVSVIRQSWEPWALQPWAQL